MSGSMTDWKMMAEPESAVFAAPIRFFSAATAFLDQRRWNTASTFAMFVDFNAGLLVLHGATELETHQTTMSTAETARSLASSLALSVTHPSFQQLLEYLAESRLQLSAASAVFTLFENLPKELRNLFRPLTILREFDSPLGEDLLRFLQQQLPTLECLRRLATLPLEPTQRCRLFFQPASLVLFEKAAVAGLPINATQFEDLFNSANQSSAPTMAKRQLL